MRTVLYSLQCLITSEAHVDFSICIPTYNRADLLHHSLEKLRALEHFGKRFEVVVSDNASTDDTPRVVESMQGAMPYLRHCRQASTVEPFANYLNAMRKATGEAVVYLADDDSIIPENLIPYIERLLAEPGLAGIYTDWINYDDAQEKELHRYFECKQPATFGPDDPLALVAFVLANQIHPEIGVFRRTSFVRALRHVKHAHPFHLWMYHLSRLGRIAFELAPFYRENRILKDLFKRTHSTGTAIQLHMIGDELRNSLECMTLLAFQDAGLMPVPEDRILAARRMIDSFVHGRTSLEILRATLFKNWILALELRQRMVLWYGPGTNDEQARDALEIALPAALQSVAETYRSLSAVNGIALRGFESTKIRDFFRTHYPEIPLVTASDPAGLQVQTDPVALYRESSQIDEAHGGPNDPRCILSLNELLETYRVGRLELNLEGL